MLSVWHFQLTSYPFGTRQFYSAILYEVPNKIQFVRELWRPLLQENKTFVSRQFPKSREMISRPRPRPRQWGSRPRPRPRHRKTCLETSRDRDSVSRQYNSDGPSAPPSIDAWSLEGNDNDNNKYLDKFYGD